MRTTITVASLTLCFVATLASPASARHRHHLRHPEMSGQYFPQFQPPMMTFVPDAGMRSTRRMRTRQMQAPFNNPFMTGPAQPPMMTAWAPAVSIQPPRRKRGRLAKASFNPVVAGGPGFPAFQPAIAAMPGTTATRRVRRVQLRAAAVAANASAVSRPIQNGPARSGFGGGGLVDEARRYIGGN